MPTCSTSTSCSHVGCVAYSYETYELVADDLAVNRAVVETDLTDGRDTFCHPHPPFDEWPAAPSAHPGHGAYGDEGPAFNDIDQHSDAQLSIGH